MPPETGYESRVRVGPAAPVPRADPEDFGAGIGRAVEQGAQVVHRGLVEKKASERRLAENAELAQSNVAFARLREEMAAADREGRKSDEAGHAERMARLYEERSQALLDGIQSERVRQRVSGAMANWGAAFRTGAADWETARQGEIAVEGTQEAIAASANRTRRLEKSSDYATERQVLFDMIAGLDASDEVKAGLEREAEQTLAVSYLLGMNERAPAAAKAVMQSGAFDDVLTPQQMERLQAGADVEIHKIEVRAAREAEEARAEVRTRIGVFRKAVEQDLDVDVASFDEAIAAATALDDPELVLELEGLRDGYIVKEVWGPKNATPIQRERRIAELARRDNLSDSEARELAGLRKWSPGWDREFNSDPTGSLARSGGASAPPQIDLQDPGTWGPRVGWAVERGYPPLSDAEVQVWQSELAREGGEGRVLEMLDRLPGGIARAVVAEQFAPSDPVFQRMAQLRPLARAVVRQGQKAVANNESFFKPDDLDARDAIDKADRDLAYALREVDQDFLDGTRDLWKFYAAGQLTANGREDASRLGGDSGSQLIRSAVAISLGGTRRGGKWVGGLGTWRGRAVVVPENMTQAEFGRALQAHWESTPNPPVNPDGSRADLFKAYPVILSDGRYGWETPGGEVVRAKDGAPFVSVIRR